jgi:hypothetical protein
MVYNITCELNQSRSIYNTTNLWLASDVLKRMKIKSHNVELTIKGYYW